MAKSTKKRGAHVNIALDATKQKQFNQKVHKVRQKGAKVGGDESGVVYISRLPWGFDEHPMRDYFRQFGKIKQLRVSRSKKTGNSRGYAYIQFQHDEVAKIVAETMNNYLMFGKLIKCRHLATPHPDTFKNASKKFFKPGGETRKAIEKHNSHKSEEAVEKSQKKMLAKYTKLQAKLAASGINYKLKDEMVEKCRAEIKEKSAQKLAELKKNKAESDQDESDDDDSGSDSDSNEEEDTEVPKFSLMGSKTDKTSKPVKISQSVPTTPKSAKIQKKASQSTSKPKGGQSLIPNEVDTPKGKRTISIEDSSDEEIDFKTPPSSIKSSKLDKTVESTKPTPEPKKVSPKRKNEMATPKSSAKKAKMSPEEPAIPRRMTLRTPKTGTPKTPNVAAQKTPNVAAQKTPKTAAPKTPKAAAPKTPKTAAPKTPNVAEQKTPKAATQKTQKAATQKTPKAAAQKTPSAAATPKTPKAATQKTPKIGNEQSVGKSAKKGLATPKSAGKTNVKANTERNTQSGRKVKTPKR